MGIYQKLGNIQHLLKCNKSQYNSFGKYNYRSCEDILESAKPICHANGCVLTLSDEVALIGERFYIKAIATLTDVESGEQVQNVAYAREENEKKGMDGSQISGTASSYARKYCLNGLFCIDDTKDADTDEFHKQTNRDKAEHVATNNIAEQRQDTNQNNLVCSSCGATITQKIADYSMTKFNRQLCFKCQKNV